MNHMKEHVISNIIIMVDLHGVSIVKFID